MRAAIIMNWLQLLFGMMTLIRYSKPQLVNIARGKPAFQSSQYWSLSPDKAVDGDKTTDISGCTHTAQSAPETTNPWWAVDLQWSRPVGSVNITNRGWWGYRLSNIRIGTTDVSPVTTAPTPTNFDICVTHDEPVANGATVQFACEGQGRYLVVLLEGSDKILTLCEVEVYMSASSRERSHFWRSVNARLAGYVFDTLEVLRVLDCASGCIMETQCSSFNLQSVTSGSMTCELNGEVTNEQITDGLTTDPLYAFYRRQ